MQIRKGNYKHGMLVNFGSDKIILELSEKNFQSYNFSKDDKNMRHFSLFPSTPYSL